MIDTAASSPEETRRYFAALQAYKPLVATFDQQQASSDGGGVLLKAAERVYGLVKAFAGCLTDKRAPEKIRHTLADVIGQRIFGIACGHPDGNDADHLADDPIHKLLLGRDPVTGARLASQPTISRFENDVRRSALYRMGRELAACVIERHRDLPISDVRYWVVSAVRAVRHRVCPILRRAGSAAGRARRLPRLVVEAGQDGSPGVTSFTDGK